MLYLEDYLEMIEHLPQELRDRFTEMREMDLSVQNSMDSLEKRVKCFFGNAKKMKPSDKENEYEIIRKDYYKTLEDADEKVHLANQMYDLVDRYLRRLDQELHKFKMELEADNAGITEVLEKRSLELDQPQTNSSQKENRYNFNSTRMTHHEKRRDSNSTAMTIEKRVTAEKTMASLPETRPTSAGSGSIPVAVPPPNPTNVSYNLGHIGAGGNAIAAAASQAIAATQQMQQGRRTASLKASYEAINIGVHGHEFSIGKELAGAAQTAIAAIQETTKKQKKKSTPMTAVSSTPSSASASSASAALPAPPAAPVASIPTPVVPSPPPPPEVEDHSTDADTSVDPNAENPDWTYDPNEPRYCICNQVSYGYMVACDNEDCPFEWFHYACVDIKAPPKGKWYCPQCTSSMKRRGSRKN